ncbi:hypothetical protein DL765_008390 [Monosporascus sp. GIB2]|nr:hypothetical protein DL765_008390 [Monosporascus sp. GIB2]
MSEKTGKGLDGLLSAFPVNPPSAPAATTDIRSTERHTRLDKLEREHRCTWDGIADPLHLYNWSWTRKLMIGIVFSLGHFVTLLSASTMAAALGDISRDLGINASTVQILFSCYILGLGFAPFLIAPISEMTSRKYIWLFCNGWALCMIRGIVLMPAGLFLVWLGFRRHSPMGDEHGASANASSRMFSYVVGFAFPIFAPQLYAQLGYGWGNSLLASLFIFLGYPVPLIVWFWGEKLRDLGTKSAER